MKERLTSYVFKAKKLGRQKPRVEGLILKEAHRFFLRQPLKLLTLTRNIWKKKKKLKKRQFTKHLQVKLKLN